MDARFIVEVIAQTPNPQQLVYTAMHQDYAEGFVWAEREAHVTSGGDRWPNEQKSGDLIVKNLLSANRGHYGPLEHPQITLNCGYFPHSTMQQMRTHRVGVSFDVQCLAVNTEVTFVNHKEATKQTLKKTIGELYSLWANKAKATQLWKMQLSVLNEETGAFEAGQIKEVMYSGIQPVYRVTLEDGKTLDCTVNHQLLTSEGWQTLGKAVGLLTASDDSVVTLTRSCSVMCNGMAAAGDGLYTEAAEFTKSSAKSILKTQGCLFQPKPINHNLLAHPVKIQSVEYLGEQMTYDLEVEGPWHNFVANGMVVHNSFRYTGQRLISVAEGKLPVEEVFYLRPLGSYTDRQGKRYTYSEAQRQQDIDWCLAACHRYQERINQGFSEEHARGLIPFDVRQHWVLSANARSLLHLLDLRWKADAQLEAQHLCELIWPHFKVWMPAVADWYEVNRLKKARLAP